MFGRGLSRTSAKGSPWQMATAVWIESKKVQEKPLQNVLFITLTSFFPESGFSMHWCLILFLLVHLLRSYKKNLITRCNESLTVPLNSFQCLRAAIQYMLINLKYSCLSE